MIGRPDVALLFPPTWYFSAVPADLSHTAGSMRARGRTPWCWDGSAALLHRWMGDSPAFAAYQRESTFADPAAHAAAEDALYAGTRALGLQYGADVGPRHLRFPDLDEAHVPRALQRGLDPFRNPALPLLTEVAEQVRALDPTVVAIALVHPDQRVQALALASLIRRFHARVVLYGCLEDVFAPGDFAPSLIGGHALFQLVHGVIVGDADDALAALSDPDADLRRVPNLLLPDATALPVRVRQDLSAPADFRDVRPEHHLMPTPIVDLRLGRGCPWGRCAFCGIQAHHPGYRAGPLGRVVQGMQDAHTAFGARWFRIRDDLLTPRQLRELGEATASLPFRPRWSARARFTTGLGEGTVQAAVAGGLDELWLGLESAVPRVRALMDKGVDQPTVHRVLAACAAHGVRVRLLCMVGFPGETEAEARRTLAFLAEHPTAEFSLTPYMEVRSAPGSRGAVPAGPDRIDHLVPTHRPAWVDAVLAEGVALAGQRASPGPDPSHRWRAAVARR